MWPGLGYHIRTSNKKILILQLVRSMKQAWVYLSASINGDFDSSYLKASWLLLFERDPAKTEFAWILGSTISLLVAEIYYLKGLCLFFSNFPFWSLSQSEVLENISHMLKCGENVCVHVFVRETECTLKWIRCIWMNYNSKHGLFNRPNLLGTALRLAKVWFGLPSKCYFHDVWIT